MTEPRRLFRALLRPTLCSLFFVVCFLFGAVAADPLAAARAFGEALLRAARARVELFRSADGTAMRAFALGPPSGELPVVLLHGLGADATYWTFIARALVERGRTVILLDGPGSGGSEAPRSPEGYGLRARVLGIGAMAQALGLDRFDLVGHSLGGWTAAAYAIESPHRVARLVLVDAAGFDEIRPGNAEAEKARLVPSDRTSSSRLLDLLFFRRPLPVPGFILDAIGRNYGSGGPAATVESFGEADFLTGHEDRLPRGTVLIWGEKETLFPLAQARRVAGRIPGGRLLVITNVGHDGPLEAPKIFRQALFEALGMPP